MNKKGEIDLLTKNILPNIGVITNISYAHIENFKNLNGIAKAKSEIIDNIVEDGSIILSIAFSKVVFPEPFLPFNKIIFPAPRDKLILSNTI